MDSSQKIPLEGDEEIVFNGDDVVYLRIKRDKMRELKRIDKVSFLFVRFFLKYHNTFLHLCKYTLKSLCPFRLSYTLVCSL